MSTKKLHFNIDQIVWHIISGNRGIVVGVLYKKDYVLFEVCFKEDGDIFCSASELSVKKVIEGVNDANKESK